MEGSFERPPLRPESGTPPKAARGSTRGRRPAARRAAADGTRRATPADRNKSRGGRPARPRGEAGRGGDPRPPTRRGHILLIALAFALVAIAVAGYTAYASLSRQLPDPTRQLLGRDQTTRILDREGHTIADLFAEQDRTNVALADIPVTLRQAVVATEDERFYRHSGVDPLGIARALWTDVVQHRKAQGGSTITQQYVKKAFLTDERSLKRKLQEALLAYRVEKRFGKDRILEMYLNTIYFGHGAYGVERAAEGYFGRPVERLDLAQSAMLAGVIKSPSRYSPRVDPATAKQRRHIVLVQMRDQGYIDDAAFRKADAEPFHLAPLKRTSTTAPYFVEYVKNTLLERFGADVVYRGGLTVRTTLDARMQRAAEKAVRETLDRKGDPSAALVAIDPATGEVRAMVGGSDFGTQQYNVAVQGHRQPGSAFKPFVLAAALQDGVSPEQTFECGPVELTPEGATTPWKVTGAGGDRTGPMRLREATEKSVNSVFAQLILQIGADRVTETAKAMGITTSVRALPAIALGGLDQGVSPLEMASAYGTLADRGVHVAPHGVTTVNSAGGKTLFTASRKGERELSEAVAYLTTDILKGVIAKGTGSAADIGRPSAGKTGTTQAYRDAWFCGYTPDLAASVWVGYPDAAREMTSVHGRKVTGGSFPAEIWSRFMKDALAGTEEAAFEAPDSGLTTATVCLDTGLLATAYCPRTAEGLFLSGDLPGTCKTHTEPIQVTVPNVVGLTRASAEAALKKAGLSMSTSSSASPDGSGTVSSQSPAAGTKAKRGSTVRVEIESKGYGAPIAAFIFSVTSGSLAVTFDPSASTGAEPLTYEWSFGDGATSAERAPSHTYDKKRAYEVRLTITDAQGRTARTTRKIKLD